jgi:hypothetical protein
MNLQEHIRKVLIETVNESLFFRRRVDMRLMEKEFFETLNFATDMFLKRRYAGIDFTFKDFKERVIDYLMDGYHSELSDGGLNDFPYDEVYEFLSDHFHRKIKDRYDSIFDGEEINEGFKDMIKSMFGKKPLTKDDKLINAIAEFINENYSIDFESVDYETTFYLTNDTGNWIFPPIMEYYPKYKKLHYSWKFAEDIHNWIGDDRLLQPDSEMMGKIFEKLFNKEVIEVYGYSRL